MNLQRIAAPERPALAMPPARPGGRGRITPIAPPVALPATAALPPVPRAGSAGPGGQLGDTLRADAQQGGDVADGQASGHKLGSSLAGAGGRGRGELIGLPAQLPDL